MFLPPFSVFWQLLTAKLLPRNRQLQRGDKLQAPPMPQCLIDACSPLTCHLCPEATCEPHLRPAPPQPSQVDVLHSSWQLANENTPVRTLLHTETRENLDIGAQCLKTQGLQIHLSALGGGRITHHHGLSWTVHWVFPA